MARRPGAGLRIGIGTAAALALTSCAHQEIDRNLERKLAREHSSCLALGLPATSSDHTECVLFRYQQRQRQQERLRSAVLPEPAEAPVTEFPSSSD